jgi:hypothetical protein
VAPVVAVAEIIATVSLQIGLHTNHQLAALLAAPDKTKVVTAEAAVEVEVAHAVATAAPLMAATLVVILDTPAKIIIPNYIILR